MATNTVITAEQAQKITTESTGMIDRIHVQIKTEAELWNRSVCYWGFDGVSDDKRDEILDQLKEEGYTITVIMNEETNEATNQYKISW